MSAHGRGKGGRWRRSLKWAARVALVGLLLVVALAGVVLLLLTLPVGRQWTARIASEQLSNALIGRVEITPPRQVRLDRIAGFDVTVWEPNGRAVLRAERVEVSWRPQILLRSLVAGTTPHVDLSYLGAERVELDLKRQEEPPGLLLARALSPANQQAEEGVAQAEDEQASLLLAVDDIAA